MAYWREETRILPSLICAEPTACKPNHTLLVGHKGNWVDTFKPSKIQGTRIKSNLMAWELIIREMGLQLLMLDSGRDFTQRLKVLGAKHISKGLFWLYFEKGEANL